MLVFVFLLRRHLGQTIKIGANFFCNSLLHRRKRILISGQVFCQFYWNLVENEKDYSLTLEFQIFSKMYGGRCETEAPLWQFSNPCKVKIGPKRGQICILYSNCDKKRLNAINMVFSRLVIQFPDHFF